MFTLLPHNHEFNQHAKSSPPQSPHNHRIIKCYAVYGLLVLTAAELVVIGTIISGSLAADGSTIDRGGDSLIPTPSS